MTIEECVEILGRMVEEAELNGEIGSFLQPEEFAALVMAKETLEKE